MIPEKIVVVAIILFAEYFLVLMAILADLWSGVRKAIARGEARTSYGYRRTVDKLSKYYNFMFAFTVMDGMQMIAIWYLDQYYDYSVPLLPVATLAGAIGLSAIEIKSIYEKADEKVKKGTSSVMQLAQEIAKHRTEPEEIAKYVAQYLNEGRAYTTMEKTEDQ